MAGVREPGTGLSFPIVTMALTITAIQFISFDSEGDSP